MIISTSLWSERSAVSMSSVSTGAGADSAAGAVWFFFGLRSEQRIGVRLTLLFDDLSPSVSGLTSVSVVEVVGSLSSFFKKKLKLKY